MSKFELGKLCSRRRMRGESRASVRLIDAAASILEQEHPMTIRQLFYRLVGTGQIDNTKQEYQRVSRLMTIARRDGRCEYGWIVDRSRPEYTPNVWENAAAYAEAIKRSYRRDCWQDQPCHIEVWTEKDAITSSIEPVTRELGVTVRVFRGFSSTTLANEIAETFSEIDKDIHVFYLGDHDPSGIDIERDILDRVGDFSGGLALFDIKRLAIHAADIQRFNLPTQKVKTKDRRHGGFLQHHGDKCVELDALPPNELRRRVREAIEVLIDREPWDRHLLAEKVERDSIIDLANRMKNLPSVGGAL